LEKGLRFNNLICVNDRSFYSEAVFTADRIWLTHEQIVRYRVNNSASLVGNRARNFHCEFDSWQLIMNQCTKYNIQGRELAIVMERELIDIFIWYRKYKKIPEISEEITAQTQAFAQKLDISPLEAFPPSFKWYYDYLTFLPEFEILTKNYNNITQFKKQARLIMPQCTTPADFRHRIQEAPATDSTSIRSGVLKKLLSHFKH
ncbi:MAG: hypothetical protein EGR04_09380, partial [Blautia sp.]|nr:hypothetical protein [Blautia sp.]